MAKHKSISIIDPVYGHELKVKIGTKTTEKDAAGYFLEDTIWLEKFDKSPYRIAVLVHEVTHAAFAFLKKSGVRTEEAHAYYVQYLTEEILKKLLRN